MIIERKIYLDKLILNEKMVLSKLLQVSVDAENPSCCLNFIMSTWYLPECRKII